MCVFGLRFRLCPATSGLGAGLFVCSSCTPPLLAGVCGLGVCAWARVSAAPRHSWLGCWAVCVLVTALCLHPATPGSGARCGCVCLGSGFGCAPPLLAGVLGCLCAPVRAPLAPRHSWLGCAVWVCVLGLGFRLRPATPGWGVGVCLFVCLLPLYSATLGRGARRRCVCLGSGFGCAPPLLAGVWGCACLCACPPCTQPLLAGVCGGVVCVWPRVSAAPRHSWLGCWAVCVLGCWGAAETRAQTHTPPPHTPARSGGVQGGHAHEHAHPHTRARSGGAQPKPEPKHTHPRRAPRPRVAGYRGSRDTNTHSPTPSQEWRGAAET